MPRDPGRVDTRPPARQVSLSHFRLPFVTASCFICDTRWFPFVTLPFYPVVTLPFFTQTPILYHLSHPNFVMHHAPSHPPPPIWRADDFSVAERLKHAMAAPMGSEDGWEAGPQGGRIVDPNLFSCSLKRGFTLRPGSAADALQRALAEVKFSHEFHSFVCAFVFLPFVAPFIGHRPFVALPFAAPNLPHPIHHTPFTTPHSSHPLFCHTPIRHTPILPPLLQGARPPAIWILHARGVSIDEACAKLAARVASSGRASGRGSRSAQEAALEDGAGSINKPALSKGSAKETSQLTDSDFLPERNNIDNDFKPVLMQLWTTISSTYKEQMMKVLHKQRLQREEI